MHKPELRSPLSVVRGLGSAREGTGHFIAIRVTSVILIPLCLWLVYSLLDLAVSADRVTVINWLASGFNASALIILLLAGFYHSKLGMQTIIEDYVHCPVLKMSALLANVILMLVLAAVSVLAVLKIHLIS